MIDSKLNVSLDLGHLLVLDNQPFKKDFLNEEDMLARGKQNIQNIFKNLFNLCKIQKGEEEEKRDFDKADDSTRLPNPNTILPRSKPIPKPRAATKWEKFRLEKGIEKKKRSRLVYSETAGDWVPRWGKGRYIVFYYSAKKIEDITEWAIEEKPGMDGKNPFELKNQDKKLQKMKQKKREMKNEENNKKKHQQKASEEKNVQQEATNRRFKNKKLNKMQDEKNKLKSEKKGLEKTLEIGKKTTIFN